MTYTVEELKERFETLPEDVQVAIKSIETADAIEAIQQKYKLHIDQAGLIAEEVGLVMLGFSRPFDFVARIASKLHITQMVASEITKDINENIFNPIKESLKKIHSLNGGDGTTTKTQPSDINTDSIDAHLSSVKKREIDPTSPVATFEEKSNNPDQLFDQKLKGLFTSSNTTPTSSDPYREPLA